MPQVEIIAHRGLTTDAPENTIAAFQRAIDLGADGVELDVRLTADRVPVVYHYYYLDGNSTAAGPIFNYTLEQLRKVEVRCMRNPTAAPGRISTLAEILEVLAGRTRLEIEIKGPEPEASAVVAEALKRHRHSWEDFEVTSYEPALLLAIQEACPGLAADLLYPPAADWKKLDVVMYEAIHRARLAHARAVHLHPDQLTEVVVAGVRSHGMEIHTYDVNDARALEIVMRWEIPRLCTDNLPEILSLRDAREPPAVAGGT